MLRSPQAVSMQPEVSTNEAAAGRTVSMQTVLDKVHQELAMQQAVGQTITRSAEETITARSRLSGILPYIVATSVTVAVLIVIAIIVSSTNAPALPPTSTVVAAVVSSPTSVLPTATTVPPTTAVPLPVVATDVPSQTPIPPTLTPLPSAHTPVLSSATMVPPTVANPPAETSSSVKRFQILPLRRRIGCRFASSTTPIHSIGSMTPTEVSTLARSSLSGSAEPVDLMGNAGLTGQ